MPYGKTTNDTVQRLAKLPIKVIAPMHGSVIVGDVCQVILDKVKADLVSRSG